MEDSDKSLAKVKINNINCSLLINQAIHLLLEGH